MEKILRVNCCHSGCSEVGIYSYDNRAEYSILKKRYSNWKCVRHNHPERVLSFDNQETKVVMEVYSKSYGKFWREAGSKNSGSSFLHGQGFKAFADDFEDGQKIEITSRLLIQG